MISIFRFLEQTIQELPNSDDSCFSHSCTWQNLDELWISHYFCRMKIFYTSLLIFSLNLLTFSIFGQELQNRLELASPHDAIWVHLYYLQPDQYDPALAATVFLEGDSVARVDLAIKLKQIFDGEGLFMQMNLLPREADYQDSISNKPYFTPFPEALPQIYLERIDSQWHY
jgi:MscS family membrane protein